MSKQTKIAGKFEWRREYVCNNGYKYMYILGNLEFILYGWEVFQNNFSMNSSFVDRVMI